MPPGSPNSDPISEKNVISFHARFQTWPLRNYVIIEQLMKEMKGFGNTV